MVTPLGVTSWCICELTSIKDLDRTITLMGPTAQQEYSELQETSTNVTTQDIFTEKDIRGARRSNSDMVSTSTHQWAQIDGDVTMVDVVIPPIIRKALQQEGDSSLAEGIVKTQIQPTTQLN